MKKLLYIALTYFDNSSDGVSKKVQMQCDAFRKNGYEVFCAAYGNDGCYIYSKENKVRIANFNNIIPPRITLEKAVVEYLKDNAFNTCFIRYSYTDFLFIKILKQLKKKKTKIIVEFPTFPIMYPKLNSSNLKKLPLYILDSILSRNLKKYVDIALTIGNPVESAYGITTFNIPNGINIDEFKPHTTFENITDTLNILCIASMFFYQGYDRLIEGLINYYTDNTYNKKIHVHFVGDGPEEERYKRRCVEGNIQEYVTFHGRLSGEELENICDKSDIACAMLAIHRSHLKSASPLKTKEYFARGIPFIYAYEEIGLPDNYPYTMRISANDDPVDMNHVVGFYNSYKDHYSEVKESMRKFAKENYAWDSILKFI